MSIQKLKTEEILKAAVNDIRDQVRDDLLSKNIPCSIQSGLSKVLEGYIGFISCFPKHQATEDSIDAVIQILERVGRVDIIVDVNWSNGNPIKDIEKVSIPYSPELGKQITDFMQRIKPLVINTFSHLLSG